MTPASAERRREPRYPCNDAVEVRLLPGGGTLVPATLLDISRSGLRLAIEAALVKGSQIQIHMPKQIVIFGKVRHCRRVGSAYEAGILIEQAFYSSESSMHLTAEQVATYLSGAGLTVPQVVRIREHLAQCGTCRLLMLERYSMKDQAQKRS